MLASAEELKAEAERQLNVDPQRSLEIAEQITDGAAEASEHALGLLARADALRVLGRRSEAAQAYAAAAELFRSIGDEVGWARTRIGATVIARYTGAHPQILAELDDARRILARHAQWLRLARLENSSGVLLSALGRNQESVAAHQRALAAAERIAPPDEIVEGEVLGNLSLAYYKVDDFAQAESLLNRATAIFERHAQAEHLARAHRNYARYAAGRGHYSKALAAVVPGRRALLTLGRVDAAAHLGQVGVDCLVRLNRHREAASLAETVAHEFQSAGAPIEAATSHTLRAMALARQDLADEALAALEQAEALFGELSWTSGAASTRVGRALVLGQAGRWEEALVSATAAVDELRKRGSAAAAAQAELVRARSERALGRTDRATTAARAALELVADRGLHWLDYEGWRLLAEIAYDAGDPGTALAGYLEAIANLEHLQGRILTEYRASFLADKVDVFEPAVQLLLDAGRIDQAYELVERAKSRALVDALAGGLDISVRARTAEQSQLVDELTRLRHEHDDLIEGDESGPRRRELERAIDTTLEELRLAGADDLERLSLLESKFYSPQGQLDAHTALVEYFAIGPDLAIFVVDHETVRAARVANVRPRLERLQRSLQLNLEGTGATADRRAALEPNARALLQRLYAVLVEPVEPWLAGYTRLVFVPHGTLHHLPLAALHDGHGYLIERFEVVHAPSASSLAFCLRARTRDSHNALVVAHSANGGLPGVADEARQIGRLLGTDPLLEDDASVAEFRQRARKSDVIHVAAHGIARQDAPLFSSLRLADGHLTALDCFDLELDCALVTLSACESGRSVVSAGDEQIGLARAFLYAGARSVVHSLWRVDDRATQALMQSFYTDLRLGTGRGAALRRAQLNQLQSGAVHPFEWAAFTLVGDWR